MSDPRNGGPSLKYRLVTFDLDDTLAVSKSAIAPRMASLLVRLLDEVKVCIISGGRFEQFDTQVLQHLELTDAARERLHLMPTCGTRYYRWEADRWDLVYAEDFGPEEKAKILDTLETGAKELGLWEDVTWGDILEDRGSQITFSALGQSAPAENKYKWDPDGTKKERLRAYAAERLPDLEVRGGGSTSVDITKKGVDKAYGMRKMLGFLQLDQEDVLFIGDRLDPGGNDYPVKAMGIDCVAVHGWEDTADRVAALLDTGTVEEGAVERAAATDDSAAG
ncbi:HAD-IIB family hydrolase [Catenulispora yoronensis]|uniref:phosphomannomutase n=1 Tax=Catenulispora yoronensis TaxID=450799 RepID=A0ABN2UK69_9ACTN